jgi:hypothetical protein
MLRRILDQERTPVFTGLLVLTTVATVFILILLFVEGRRPNIGWGGLVIGALFTVTCAVSLLAHFALGAIAATRGEVYAGRIAATGVGICLATLAVMAVVGAR